MCQLIFTERNSLTFWEMLIHFAVKIQMRWSVPLSSGCMVRTLSQALYLTTFLYFAWAFPGFQRETFDFWECHLSLLLFMELENQILLSLKVRETENQMIMLLHDWWIFKKSNCLLTSLPHHVKPWPTWTNTPKASLFACQLVPAK